MIVQRNEDGTREAIFSDDMRMRYRLTYGLSSRGLEDNPYTWQVCTFVMLNPSTADAFKADPTVKRCMTFARRWGCNVLKVVNLFALRSSTPGVLYDGSCAGADECGGFSHLWRASVGADMINDEAIVAACAGAERIIAAWGAHGALAMRGDEVSELLSSFALEALHVSSKSGQPIHPLARGKHRVPDDIEPIVWKEAT